LEIIIPIPLLIITTESETDELPSFIVSLTVTLPDAGIVKSGFAIEVEERDPPLDADQL
jgi:hypothetical protein